MDNIEVINLQGMSILKKQLGQAMSTELNLSQHPDDIYILQIIHQRGITTKKIVLDNDGLLYFLATS